MSDTDFQANALFEQALSAISTGYDRLLLWGLNPVALRFIGLLNHHGLTSTIAAVVDLRLAVSGREVAGIRTCGVDEIGSIEFDTLVLSDDRGKERVLQEFASLDQRRPVVIFAGDGQYEFENSVFEGIVKSCAVKSKAGGYPHMLVHLFQSLQYVVERGLKGHVAEFGVYQGGTTVFMAKVLAHYGHAGRIWGFDTFEGFPAQRSVLDLYRDSQCEFPDFQAVRAYCAAYKIDLIPGDIRETYLRLEGVPLVLSFFDTDNYSATKAALPLCVRQDSCRWCHCI